MTMRKNDEIVRNGQKMQCELRLHDGELGLSPKFNLLTISNGRYNRYIINARICGLVQCKESSLYFAGRSVEHISDHKNEYTLTEKEVLNIFYKLTQD